jgi:hypothetical protein
MLPRLFVALAAFLPAQSAPPASEMPLARPAETVLQGRFLLEGGAPARGIAVELGGYSTRPRRGERIEPWRSPLVHSDDEGRFRLGFEAPPSYQFTLTVKAPGYVGASWRWTALQPGELVELGDVVFERGGAVGGAIVDREGKPVRAVWNVYGDRVRATPTRRVEPPRAQGVYEPASGRFLLEDLPPGPVKLQGYSRLGGWLDGPTVEVYADEVVEAELRFDGPDTTRRIAVQIDAQPFYAFASEIEGVYLDGEGVEERAAKRDPRLANTFVFDDLPAGPFTVEVRDPRFRAWRREGVEPGTALDARLAGAGVVVLDVRDAKSGEPVTRYALKTRFEEGGQRGNVVELYPRPTEAPAGGRLAGLVPRPQTFTIAAPGYAVADARVDAFPEGEPAIVRVELARGAAVEGRVTEADGTTPVAFVEVEIVSRDDTGAMAWSPWNDADLRRTTTDAAGRYRFEALGPGRWHLRAPRSLLLVGRADVEIAAGGPEVVAADVAFPAHGEIDGRVLAGEELDLSGALISAAPIANANEVRNRWNALLSMQDLPPGFEVAADGSFRLAPVAAGTLQLELVLPPALDLANGIQFPQHRIPLGPVDVAAGAVTTKELDVRATGPGALDFALLVDGRTAERCEIALTPRTGSFASSVVRTNADGLASSGLLLPGEYGLAITGPGGAWSWAAPEKAEVRSGERAQVTLEIDTVEAALELADAAAKAPLAHRRITVQQDSPSAAAAVLRARTDADGRATLLLVPGRYRLSCEPDRGGRAYAAVELEWTPSGPVPARVELAAPAEPK